MTQAAKKGRIHQRVNLGGYIKGNNPPEKGEGGRGAKEGITVE